MSTVAALSESGPGQSRTATPEEQEEFWALHESLQATRERLRVLEQNWLNFCYRHEGVVFAAERPKGEINA